MRVYIAGPMRGYPDYNIPAFYAAAEAWAAAGWEVINPAAMDVELDGFNPATDKAHSEFYYMKRDLPAVASCDAIALLDGWEQSSGANKEVQVARWCGLAILDANYPIQPAREAA